MRPFVVSVLMAVFDLTGVAAGARDAVALPGVLEAVATLSVCTLDADDMDTLLPVPLEVAIPPLTDVLPANVLSAPVLCLDPCQLLSLTGPT